MKETLYACNNCGISITNRSTWCDLGCGSDYNEMIDIGGRRFIDYSIAKYKDGWSDCAKKIHTELAHDQQKMLDGFAHPINCVKCKLLTDKK